MPLPAGVPLAPLLAALARRPSRACFYDRERRLVLAVLGEEIVPSAPSPSRAAAAPSGREKLSHAKAKAVNKAREGF